MGLRIRCQRGEHKDGDLSRLRTSGGTLTLPCAVSRLPGLQRLSHGGKEVGRLTGDDMPSP